MSDDALVLFWITLALAVLAFVQSRRLAGTRRRLDWAETQLAALIGAPREPDPAPQPAEERKRLEQRLQVLERIVTDRGYDLADRIEALRDQRQWQGGAAGETLTCVAGDHRA